MRSSTMKLLTIIWHGMLLLAFGVKGEVESCIFSPKVPSSEVSFILEQTRYQAIHEWVATALDSGQIAIVPIITVHRAGSACW